MKNGLLMLYIGNQAGTTAMALGQILRAIGRGFRICYIQFSENASAGESFRVNLYNELLEFHPFEKNSTDSNPESKNPASSALQWKLAQKAIDSRKFRIVVLEGLTELFQSGSLNRESVVDFLRACPADTNIIVTGPDAPRGLIDSADLVTEVRKACQ
jgi:cob(I)alamin adenosyltransferase